eukprot:m.175423 g.175423  ORF g.175423 m.175423 type:complete len:782 (+) comp17347_c0_seq5:171-2516(+)
MEEAWYNVPETNKKKWKLRMSCGKRENKAGLLHDDFVWLVAPLEGDFVQAPRHQRRPARLVAGTAARARLWVKVLVEQHEILPTLLRIQRILTTKRGSRLGVWRLQEQIRQPLAEHVANFQKVQLLARSLAEHFEAGAEGVVVALEALDEEPVHGHPDRTAPVAVATKEVGVGLGRLVRDRVAFARQFQLKGLQLVLPGHAADAKRGEEFVAAQHCSKHAPEAVPRGQGKQIPLWLGALCRAVVCVELLAGFVDEEGDLLSQVMRVLQKPVKALLEARQLDNVLFLEHKACKERHQADHGPQLQSAAAARLVDEVVKVEARLLVPKSRLRLRSVEGVADLHKVLEELAGNVLVRVVVLGQLEGNVEHGDAVKRHPGGAVGLLQPRARGQRLAPVKDADVIEAEESTAEDVLAVFVLAVHPPGEVQQELLKARREEGAVALFGRGGHAVDAKDSPRMHRRIDVAKGKLIGWDLPVRVHVPLAQHHGQLLLGKGRVYAAHGNHVEGEVPGCVPWVFPLVRHGDDVAVEEVHPVGVAAAEPLARRRRLVTVALEPVADDVVVELLGPEEACEGLALHQALVWGQLERHDLRVKVVSLFHALLEGLVEAGAEHVVGRDARALLAAHAEADDGLAARRHLEDVVEAGLGAASEVADGRVLAMDDVAVEGVLDKGRVVVHAKEHARVGLVLRQQRRRCYKGRRLSRLGTIDLGGCSSKIHVLERLMRARVEAPHVLLLISLLLLLGLAEVFGGDDAGFLVAAKMLAAPDPGVAEPHCRNDVNGCRLR